MRYCSNCGQMLNEQQLFCHNCGSKVIRQEINNQNTQYYTATLDDSDTEKEVDNSNKQKENESKDVIMDEAKDEESIIDVEKVEEVKEVKEEKEVISSIDEEINNDVTSDSINFQLVDSPKEENDEQVDEDEEQTDDEQINSYPQTVNEEVKANDRVRVNTQNDMKQERKHLTTEYKSIGNGFKVFLTTIVAIIPVFGQIIGLLYWCIGKSKVNDDGKSFKNSIGILSLIMLLLSLSLTVFIITFTSAIYRELWDLLNQLG